MRMVAPDHVSHFVFDNVEYTRGTDGTFDIQHPDHQAAAKMHGALDHDPENNNPFPDSVHTADAIKHDIDTALAAKDAEIAALRLQLEQRPEAPAAPEGSKTPEKPVMASHDTSDEAKATATEHAQLGEMIAKHPDVDAMTRDEMLTFLKDANVSVPGNVSNDVARKTVHDTINAYNKSQKSGV